MASLLSRSCFLATVITPFIAVQASLNVNFTQCGKNTQDAYLRDSNLFSILGSNGSVVHDLSQAWGVPYETCKSQCGTGLGEFQWAPFLTGIASWILPWLALTAQLPYETKDTATSISVLLLAVGSPVLLTYSLCMTTLMSRWLNEKFQALLDEASSLGEPFRAERRETLIAAWNLLHLSQHIPITISGSRLRSAELFLPYNTYWWKELSTEVERTKRSVTYALLAQTGWAATAAVIGILLFFVTSIDYQSIGSLGVAVSCLWIWMIPVNFGWVRVGTQNSSSTIKEAIERSAPKAVFRHEQTFGDANFGFKDLSASGSLGDVERGVPSALAPAPSSAMGSTQLPPALEGDAMKAGPIFNFARPWLYAGMVVGIIRAFSQMNTNLKQRTRVDGTVWKPAAESDQNFTGNSVQIEDYIFPKSRERGQDDLPQSAGKTSYGPHLEWMMLVSSFIATTAQWGTVGSAILIAYKTPVQGLGCMSGSYLVYGITSTVAWGFLLLSANLSHYLSVNDRKDHKTSSRLFSALHLLSPLSRYVGKCLAVLNAFWLLCASVLPFTNAFVNCWCMSCAVSLKKSAWVILWADDSQIADIARSSWIGGVIMSLFVTALLAIIFTVGPGNGPAKYGR